MGIIEDSSIRMLLKQYHLLNAISSLPTTVINTSIDIVDALPPFRPLAESLEWVTESTPRDWLALRYTIQDLHTDVLHALRHILDQAITHTDRVLLHTSEKPTISLNERALLSQTHLDHIRVRKYVLSALQSATNKFIDYLSSSPSQIAPIGHLARFRQMPKGRNGNPLSWLQSSLRQKWDNEDSSSINPGCKTSTEIQRRNTPSRNLGSLVLPFEDAKRWSDQLESVKIRLTFFIAQRWC